jgi:hypothetical protein
MLCGSGNAAFNPRVDGRRVKVMSREVVVQLATEYRKPLQMPG